MDLEFLAGGANALYNQNSIKESAWEVTFHLEKLIANPRCVNQQTQKLKWSVVMSYMVCPLYS